MLKKRFLYYSPDKAYYDQITEGMSDKMKQGLANALVHHMMPVHINQHGVWMTRQDYLRNKDLVEKMDLLDNDGRWNHGVPFKE